MQPLTRSSATTELFQSAPGRQAGRCDLKVALESIGKKFQSAPGRQAGRCHPFGQQVGRHQLVSIRARPAGRAMRGPDVGRHPGRGFQSAPGRQAGRCERPAAADADHHRFNPRPAGRPGDAIPPPAVGQGEVVSIRARPAGRAMPLPREQGQQSQGVSIRARPAGRAMRRRSRPASTKIPTVSIRARPAGRAMP